MQLTHTFTVPVPVDEAAAVLRNIEFVAPCMPGASLDSNDGDRFDGQVLVKLGPVQTTFQGTGRFLREEENDRHLALEAQGKESRGTGTARAKIVADLEGSESETTVNVRTDLVVTGKPAQFGKGVLSEVGDRLLSQFAQCLAERLREERDHPEASDSRSAPSPTSDRDATSPLNLVDVAAGPVLRRVAVVILGLGAAALLIWLVARAI